jgi:ribosome biogenesis protein Nip4
MKKVEETSAAKIAAEFIMRPLTEEETKMVFEKLYKFIGKVGETMKTKHVSYPIRYGELHQNVAVCKAW